MPAITDNERRVLEAGFQRRAQIDALNRGGAQDERLLQGLVGRFVYSSRQKCVCKIISLRYDWGGTFSATGYKVKKNGELGIRSRWELGRLFAEDFEHPDVPKE